jgi:hypothetical protein
MCITGTGLGKHVLITIPEATCRLLKPEEQSRTAASSMVKPQNRKNTPQNGLELWQLETAKERRRRVSREFFEWSIENVRQQKEPTLCMAASFMG